MGREDGQNWVSAQRHLQLAMRSASNRKADMELRIALRSCLRCRDGGPVATESALKLALSPFDRINHFIDIEPHKPFDLRRVLL